MARLRRHSPLGAQDSDGSTFSPTERGEATEASMEETIARLRTSPRKKAAKAYFGDECSSSEESDCRTKPVQKPSSHFQSRGKQIRLAPLSSFSLANPFGKDRLQAKDIRRLETSVKIKPLAEHISLPEPASIAPIASAKKAYQRDSSAEVEVEESIWCGSDGTSDDSDEELPSPRTFLKVLPRKSNPERKPEALDCRNRPKDLAFNESGQLWNPTELTKKLAATSTLR